MIVEKIKDMVNEHATIWNDQAYDNRSIKLNGLSLPRECQLQRPDLNFWTEKISENGEYTRRTFWIVEVNVPFGKSLRNDIDDNDPRAKTNLWERRKSKIHKYAHLVQLIRDHIATWNTSSEVHYEVKEMYIIVSSLGAISKETIKDIETFIRHEDI
jgi:hypothetical protein